MADVVEGGASLAWRLLATLEGGSLLLATSALLAYSARRRVARLKRTRRPVRRVLLTNTSNLLGKELKTRLESRGCIVQSIPETLGDAVTNNILSRASEPMSRTREEMSEALSRASEAMQKVDALVVVGAFSPPKNTGLEAMAKLVSEDVYSNLKLLESLSLVVRRGGSLAWACAGAGGASGHWDGAGDAFDTVLHSNLLHVAKMSHCEAVWVGRYSSASQAAEKLVDALLSSNTPHNSSFSIRNAAQKAGEYVGRWLKIIT